MGKILHECECPLCGAFFDVSLAPMEDVYLDCPSCHIDIYVSLSAIPGDEPEVELEDELYVTEKDILKDPSKKPQCCLACGGPFPNCVTSCKIFDE